MTGAARQAGDFAALTVIIPTLNEVQTIGSLIRHLRRELPGAQLLVADDESRDGTPDVVRRLMEEDRAADSRLQLLQRSGPVERGIAASVIDAVRRCSTAYFVVIDADFQHPPEVIPQIFERLVGGCDVVIGSRSTPTADRTGVRKLLTAVGTRLARTRLRARGLHVFDPLSGFFGARCDVFLAAVRRAGSGIEHRGYKILFDTLKWLPSGTVVDSVPFEFASRRDGQSKLRARHALYFLRALVR
ncbi:MAG: glycosyltransferase [Bdellovibrionales bacterium]|nr:glycosyltransferase [Bdellovibrionales bacterium]